MYAPKPVRPADKKHRPRLATNGGDDMNLVSAGPRGRRKNESRHTGRSRFAIKYIALKNAHAQSIMISTVAEKLFRHNAFCFKSAFLVNVHGAFVIYINNQIELVQIQYFERIIDGKPSRFCGVTTALPVGCYNDLEFATTVYMINFDQFDQADSFTFRILTYEPPFALVMHVLIVQLC